MACIETHATLRIFSEDLSPIEIGERLNEEASHSRKRDPEAKYKMWRENSFWCWQTKGILDSTDSKEHLIVLVSRFKMKKDALESLREDGCKIDVSNFWVGNGQGGPSLDVNLMTELCELKLPVWWDNYFESADET